jgi:hypothetical protein
MMKNTGSINIPKKGTRNQPANAPPNIIGTIRITAIIQNGINAIFNGSKYLYKSFPFLLNIYTIQIRYKMKEMGNSTSNNFPKMGK